MAVRLVILGQSTVDHVVPATPGTWASRMGGNALYAFAGARLWMAPSEIAVVSRRGAGYPFPIEDHLYRAGAGAVRIGHTEAEHLVEWILYEEDGARRSLPRNADLRRAFGEGGASTDYLTVLEAISPDIGEAADFLETADAVYLAPQILSRHAEAQRVLADNAAFVALDPSPHYASDMDPAALRAALPNVDALLPSEMEARRMLDLSSGDVEHAVASLLAAGFPEVALKRGGAGVTLGWEGGIETIAAADVTLADPTGAGDAFGGAYAAARLMGRDPPEAARRGIAASAVVIQS
ncbi:MAG: PfkB family carbohydrate kinase, partial [Alphaproteobacteria bacterium]|nr:PfkB family carbohydrate kinase [Alphaproteobacteria bacterium]